MSKSKKSATTDAWTFSTVATTKVDPNGSRRLRKRANDSVARQIAALRVQAGLTQRQLAKLVGTTASVICRLENADYEGHSLAMLNRIAAALNQRVEIHFVQARERVQHA